MLKIRTLVIILFVHIHALKMRRRKKCGKTKNWRFCIVFLFGAWARIWPEPGHPPKPIEEY